VVDFLAEGHLIELLQERFVEVFADDIRPGAAGPGPGIVDVLDGQVELGAGELRVGVVESLPVDAPDALEDSDIEHILGIPDSRDARFRSRHELLSRPRPSPER